MIPKGECRKCPSDPAILVKMKLNGKLEDQPLGSCLHCVSGLFAEEREREREREKEREGWW